MAKQSGEEATVISKKQQFHWTSKVSNEDNEADQENQSTEPPIPIPNQKQQQSNSGATTETTTTPIPQQQQQRNGEATVKAKSENYRRKLVQQGLKSALIIAAFLRRRNRGSDLKLVGTLFGNRRGGHVNFALQRDPTTDPIFLIELSTPITTLVKEMASGLVRIALECNKDNNKNTNPLSRRLIDQPQWRTYCNGKKSGFATKRDCGDRDREILRAVEPISMGAGVLPLMADGEIMYMRAKFERVIGSRDSEAFYMMNPDSNGAPELSIYLLRV